MMGMQTMAYNYHYHYYPVKVSLIRIKGWSIVPGPMLLPKTDRLVCALSFYLRRFKFVIKGMAEWGGGAVRRTQFSYTNQSSRLSKTWEDVIILFRSSTADLLDNGNYLIVSFDSRPRQNAVQFKRCVLLFGFHPSGCLIWLTPCKQLAKLTCSCFSMKSFVESQFFFYKLPDFSDRRKIK